MLSETMFDVNDRNKCSAPERKRYDCKKHITVKYSQYKI